MFFFIKNQFVEFGGVLRDKEKVTDIVPGDIVHVKTNKSLYKTRKLILTPGIYCSFQCFLPLLSEKN